MTKRKKQSKKTNNSERLAQAIASSVGKMEGIKPISDNSLHEGEKQVNLGDIEASSWAYKYDNKTENVSDLPYEPISKNEYEANAVEEKAQIQNFIKCNADNYVNSEERPMEDKEDLFNQKLHEKYQAYADNIQDVKQENHKTVKLPWFKETRKKFASDIFDAKMKASDIAGNYYSCRKAIDGNYYEHLDWTQEKTLRLFFNNKLRLNALQTDEFYTFKNVWKLIKLIFITRITVAKNRLYSLLSKIVKNKDYYGYDSLEEMMETTGGLPYDTLFSNHGLDPDCMSYVVDSDGKIIHIKKEMLKKKFDVTFPKPSEIPDLTQEFEDLIDEGYEDEETEKKPDEKEKL